MEYDGESFCDSCFCCSTCDQAIGTKSFVKAEGQIICQACFESDLAKKCIKCNIVSNIVLENISNYCLVSSHGESPEDYFLQRVMMIS